MSKVTATSPALIDRFGRTIEYVRLSVADKCNLRCFYCLPKEARGFAEPRSWLSFDEIERVIRVFAELGVHRLRITGGEPLVRKHFPLLVRRLAALPGINDLSLSTNAVLLARQAADLRDAGISRINVSLDTLKPERFARITGGDDLAAVLDGLAAAKAAGFGPIKINMLALKGVNDDEFEAMIEYCLANDFTLRFIEIMPMGDAGRDAGRHYLDLARVQRRLAATYGLIPAAVSGGGPARYFQVRDTSLRVGFITPLSQHFCAECNRVRLTVDGTLYLCLGQNDRYALAPLLRGGASDAELKQAVLAAIARKPERHEFRERPRAVVRFMSKTGG